MPRSTYAAAFKTKTVLNVLREVNELGEGVKKAKHYERPPDTTQRPLLSSASPATVFDQAKHLLSCKIVSKTLQSPFMIM
jgi:hypothetical protein